MRRALILRADDGGLHRGRDRERACMGAVDILALGYRSEKNVLCARALELVLGAGAESVEGRS